MRRQKQPLEIDSRTDRRASRRRIRPGGRLKPERVQLELRAMLGWRLTARGHGIARTRTFTQAGAAAKWAAFVADLAATERHAVTLAITANRVTVLLQRPSRNGINMPLLDFARQLV